MELPKMSTAWIKVQISNSVHIETVEKVRVDLVEAHFQTDSNTQILNIIG
jgi:hypothetical protein